MDTTTQTSTSQTGEKKTEETIGFLGRTELKWRIAQINIKRKKLQKKIEENNKLRKQLIKEILKLTEGEEALFTKITDDKGKTIPTNYWEKQTTEELIRHTKKLLKDLEEIT